MGAVKQLIMEIEEELNPTHCQIVLYLDKDGWYDWSAADFWDKPEHAHYIATRKEIGRYDDLYELLAARDAFNQMMHGRKDKTIY